jgi:hypothetical protein
MGWHQRLRGASSGANHVARELLYRHWKYRGQPVVLGNRTLGLSRQTKWRALAELETLGLITVERRAGHSPVIVLHFDFGYAA